LALRKHNLGKHNKYPNNQIAKTSYEPFVHRLHAVT